MRRRFRFGPCLGRGGFGEVYRVVMTTPGGLESVVAMKLLHEEVGANDDAMRRLRDEGRLLARLAHPSIPKALGTVRIGGRLGLLTTYIDGVDLAEALWSDDPPGARAVVHIVTAMASALEAAWTTPGTDGSPLRLMHRDIKPSNIRIGRHGQVALLDFGIAWFSGVDREAQTRTGLVPGSLGYMAPERMVNDGGPEIDVFGLGVCALEGLAGSVGRPFAFLPRDVPTTMRLLSDPSAFQARLDDAWERLAPVPEIVTRWAGDLLSWDPAGRPSAHELSRRGNVLSDELVGSSLRAWCRRRRWPEPEGAGPLVGQDLFEDVLDSGPRIRHKPVETVEANHAVVGNSAERMGSPQGVIDGVMVGDPGRLSPRTGNGETQKLAELAAVRRPGVVHNVVWWALLVLAAGLVFLLVGVWLF